MEDIKISVIISSYNRYESLLRAISSVKAQSHRNIEIIVVDDQSSDPRYQNAAPEGTTYIQLSPSSRDKYGFPSVGHVRNAGIAVATGQYIAFLDDDDIWLPDKISIQLSEMLLKKHPIACSEGLMGYFAYDPCVQYPLFHSEYYKNACKSFCKKEFGYWYGHLPEQFDYPLIEKHNFVITSSVMLERSLLDVVGWFDESIPVHRGKMIDGRRIFEDWELWLRCSEYAPLLYINIPLIYYDGGLSLAKKRKLQRWRLKKKLRKFIGL